jgi:RimJ/RimL family protein N-acetyltransferase
MKRIVWDQPERVMRFVASRVGETELFGYSAIGLERDGDLVAGVLYEQHNGPNVMMHVASDGSRHWMTPAYMAACFRYPFLQLGVNRVSGLVRADNKDAQRFDEALGFKPEGVLREAAADGTDLILYGMLKRECRYLDGKYHQALLKETK